MQTTCAGPDDKVLAKHIKEMTLQTVAGTTPHVIRSEWLAGGSGGRSFWILPISALQRRHQQFSLANIVRTQKRCLGRCSWKSKWVWNSKPQRSCCKSKEGFLVSTRRQRRFATK